MPTPTSINNDAYDSRSAAEGAYPCIAELWRLDPVRGNSAAMSRVLALLIHCYDNA